jgi:hypothetical protein
VASVTLAVRGQGLRASMSEYLVTEISRTAGIAVRAGTEVIDGRGRAGLQTLTLRDRASGATEVVTVSALFVMIGAEPRTEWLEGSVERTGMDSFSPAGTWTRPGSGRPAGRLTARRYCSRQACPACSRPGTCGTGPSNGSPPQ